MIHGTLRIKSRCSERTLGPVSVSDGEKAMVFSRELRSAIGPVEVPVASVVPSFTAAFEARARHIGEWCCCR